jgi:hypothetical protein
VTAASSEPGSEDVRIEGPDFGRRVVALRAQRLGTSRDGRTYTIQANASDVAGNIASATASCQVPHDER